MLDDKTQCVDLLRSNDCAIMECFRQNPEIPSENMKRLNRCRIYIKSFTLSDIVSSCGKYILHSAWHGQQCNNGRDTTMFPIWGRPNLQDWTYWRTALKSTFCTIRDRELKTPLGSWTKIPPNWEYFAMVDGDTFHLLHKEDNRWFQYQQQGRSKITFRYSNIKSRVKDPPSHIIFPVTVRTIHKSLIMDRPSSVYIKYKDDKQSTINTPWLHIDQFSKGSAF